MLKRRSVPATKRQAAKCTRDEMAGDEVSLQRNGWRRNEPATKQGQRKGGDETAETKRSAPYVHGRYKPIFLTLVDSNKTSQFRRGI